MNTPTCALILGFLARLYKWMIYLCEMSDLMDAVKGADDHSSKPHLTEVFTNQDALHLTQGEKNQQDQQQQHSLLIIASN